jgi:hypothetical protein
VRWVETETYSSEQAHLAAHPELLEPAADLAVSEALLPLTEHEAARYLEIRRQARREDP